MMMVVVVVVVVVMVSSSLSVMVIVVSVPMRPFPFPAEEQIRSEVLLTTSEANFIGHCHTAANKSTASDRRTLMSLNAFCGSSFY